jgi:hypothetical protein
MASALGSLETVLRGRAWHEKSLTRLSQGTCRLARRSVPLRAGALLLIERGERHEIRNVGTTMLRTLNLYAPPADTREGNELPRGKP